jgi:hypothetical protein
MPMRFVSAACAAGAAKIVVNGISGRYKGEESAAYRFLNFK